MKKSMFALFLYVVPLLAGCGGSGAPAGSGQAGETSGVRP